LGVLYELRKSVYHPRSAVLCVSFLFGSLRELRKSKLNFVSFEFRVRKWKNIAPHNLCILATALRQI